MRHRRPNNSRALGKPLRDQYSIMNPICELCRRKPTQEIDHIVQVAGGTFETWENYAGLCPGCHRLKHSENLRIDLIQIKVRKGEWFPDAAAELECFGRTYWFDASEVSR